MISELFKKLVNPVETTGEIIRENVREEGSNFVVSRFTNTGDEKRIVVSVEHRFIERYKRQQEERKQADLFLFADLVHEAKATGRI